MKWSVVMKENGGKGSGVMRRGVKWSREMDEKWIGGEEWSGWEESS